MQEPADRRIVLSTPLSAAVPLFALRHICLFILRAMVPLHQNVYVSLSRDRSPCKHREKTGRDKIQEMLLTVQLTNFRILGVADDSFGLKYKTGKMAAHIFRTEVKNEWS